MEAEVIAAQTEVNATRRGETDILREVLAVPEIGTTHHEDEMNLLHLTSGLKVLKKLFPSLNHWKAL